MNATRQGARHRIRYRAEVDWLRVLADLRHLGMTDLEVGKRIGVPRRTVAGWKNGGEPRFGDGMALARLWMAMTGKTLDGLPTDTGLAGFRRWT